MPEPCFSRSAAHTLYVISLQGVLLRQAALCSLQQFLRVIRSAQVGSALICELYPAITLL